MGSAKCRPLRLQDAGGEWRLGSDPTGTQLHAPASLCPHPTGEPRGGEAKGSSLGAATNTDFPRRYHRNIKGHWFSLIKIQFGKKSVANPACSDQAEPVASSHTRGHAQRAQEPADAPGSPPPTQVASTRLVPHSAADGGNLLGQGARGML